MTANALNHEYERAPSPDVVHDVPLLTTKLNIPLARTDLVPRPHLIEQLNEGMRRKLTLVLALAGFGKTTLISAWHANLSGKAWPF